MKTIYTFILLLSLTSTIQAQSVIGTWKTVDDNTGEVKSTVEIYEKKGKIYGKIVGIENPADRDKTCIYCEGKDKDKPLIGLDIIKNLEKDGDRYEDGTIFDPENGKEYKAKIWLEDDNPDILNVRGYVAFFYRTQQWKRVK